MLAYTIMVTMGRRQMKIFGLVVMITLALPATGHASAGYYPTSKGELIGVEACLKLGTASPLSLQIQSTNTQWKNVAKIYFKGLKRNDCEKGFVKIIYKWKVNVSIGGALRIWDSKKRLDYFVWPDGIEVGKRQ